MSHTGPILEGTGNTDYERYLRTDELLALQKDRSQLIHPEEHLFQIMHQTAELWLKQIDYEVDRIAERLQSNEPEHAADLFIRCTKILDLLRGQIVILETMAPADYHIIRMGSLGKGSGQESPGFQKLLDVGRRLWPSAERLLAGRGRTPLDVQRTPSQNYDLFRLIEAMMDYDAAFMKWRFTHMRLAMRVIGSRVKSLKGVPVTQLETGTRESQFPALWESISDLTAETKPEY